MRNATPQEINQHTIWHVAVTFTNPSGKRKKPVLDIHGLSKEEAHQEALAQAEHRFPEGKGHTVLEEDCWDEIDEDNTFFWTWKQAAAVDSENFFKKMDEQLESTGREVVHLPHDCDTPWFIGHKK